MKIRIDDIPYEGTSVKFALSLDSLNTRVKEGGDKGFIFSDPLTFEANLTKNPLGAEMKGVVTGRYLQPCARCSEEVPREETLPVEVVLRQAKTDREGNPAEDCEDDVGIFHFLGDYADLGAIVEELIILSLEVYWHPNEDDKGACVVCKRVVSNSVKSEGGSSLLGELLKKAGVN